MFGITDKASVRLDRLFYGDGKIIDWLLLVTLCTTVYLSIRTSLILGDFRNHESNNQFSVQIINQLKSKDDIHFCTLHLLHGQQLY